jgi:primosomal protein N' (replication factor Y) (superfamily II helicase)
MPELFAQVLLPLSLHDSYTYKVPEILHSEIKPGQRVIVQFGQKKYYAALVFSLSGSKPENMEIKEIQQILDEEPVVFAKNFELWEWIAKYYCCTLGDVFRAALPTGLKLESKSKVFSTGIDTDCELSEKEAVIVNQVEQDVVLLDDLQKRLGTKFSYAALKSLLAKNLIFIEEQVEEKYKPKTETLVVFILQLKPKRFSKLKSANCKKQKNR